MLARAGDERFRLGGSLALPRCWPEREMTGFGSAGASPSRAVGPPAMLARAGDERFRFGGSLALPRCSPERDVCGQKDPPEP